MIHFERNKEILRMILNGSRIRECAEKYNISNARSIDCASRFAKNIIFDFNMPIKKPRTKGTLILHKKILLEHIDKEPLDDQDQLDRQTIVYLRYTFGNNFLDKKQEIADRINSAFDETIYYKRYKRFYPLSDMSHKKINQIIRWLKNLGYKIKHDDILFGVKRTKQGRLART